MTIDKMTAQMYYYLTEFDILDYIYSFRNTVLDYIMYFFTMLGEHGAFWIGFCLVLIIVPKTRRIGLCCMMGLICEFIPVNVIIKPLVARVRPIYANTAREITTFVKVPSDFSFPSGHSSASLAVSVVMFRHNKKCGIILLITSFFICLSRLYFYVHYPTDVAAGIVIGGVFGIIGDEIMKKILKKYDSKKAARSQTLPQIDENTEKTENTEAIPEHLDV